jgi:hypothetical protein
MTYNVNRICRDFAKAHMDPRETGGPEEASDHVPNHTHGGRPA